MFANIHNSIMPLFKQWKMMLINQRQCSCPSQKRYLCKLPKGGKTALSSSGRWNFGSQRKWPWATTGCEMEFDGRKVLWTYKMTKLNNINDWAECYLPTFKATMDIYILKSISFMTCFSREQYCTSFALCSLLSHRKREIITLITLVTHWKVGTKLLF